MQKKIFFVLIILIGINIKNSIVFCDDEDFIQNNTTELEELIFKNKNDFSSTTYILLDLLKNLPINNISDDCYKDIQRLEIAIQVREVWAIKGKKN